MKTTAAPLYGNIARVSDEFGVSRAWIYRELTRGTIRAIKLGRATHIDMETVRAHLVSLPTAKFGQSTTGAVPSKRRDRTVAA